MDEIALCDDERHARGGEVLLCARIDDAELFDVDLAGEDIGRHIGNEGRLGFGELHIARSEDGVVCADMHIVGVFAEGDLLHIGDIGVRLILGGSDACGVPVNFAFLEGFLREVARDDIVRLPLVHEVEGNSRELLARAALHEDDRIVVGDIQKLAQKRAPLVDDLFELLVAVRDLRDGHPGARKIQKLLLRFLKHFEGQCGRACGKVISSHNDLPEL